MDAFGRCGPPWVSNGGRDGGRENGRKRRDVHVGAAFHGRQLRLYGRHAPHQLMPFLKGSPHYPLDLALEVCRESSLVHEQVFVLGRMGAHREALKLMLHELEEVENGVISFPSAL